MKNFPDCSFKANPVLSNLSLDGALPSRLTIEYYDVTSEVNCVTVSYWIAVERMGNL